MLLMDTVPRVVFTGVQLAVQDSLPATVRVVLMVAWMRQWSA
jgi:hypothetical protein